MLTDIFLSFIFSGFFTIQIKSAAINQVYRIVFLWEMFGRKKMRSCSLWFREIWIIIEIKNAHFHLGGRSMPAKAQNIIKRNTFTPKHTNFQRDSISNRASDRIATLDRDRDDAQGWISRAITSISLCCDSHDVCVCVVCAYIKIQPHPMRFMWGMTFSLMNQLWLTEKCWVLSRRCAMHHQIPIQNAISVQFRKKC